MGYTFTKNLIDTVESKEEIEYVQYRKRYVDGLRTSEVCVLVPTPSGVRWSLSAAITPSPHVPSIALPFNAGGLHALGMT